MKLHIFFLMIFLLSCKFIISQISYTVFNETTFPITVEFWMYGTDYIHTRSDPKLWDSATIPANSNYTYPPNVELNKIVAKWTEIQPRQTTYPRMEPQGGWGSNTIPGPKALYFRRVLLGFGYQYELSDTPGQTMMTTKVADKITPVKDTSKKAKK